MMGRRPLSIWSILVRKSHYATPHHTSLCSAFSSTHLEIQLADYVIRKVR